MLDRLIKMCRYYIKRYAKSKGNDGFYYMGKVHVLLKLIHICIAEADYKDVEQYTTINREWEEVFQERNFK